MTANTSLLLSNPDFASLRASLVDFLQSQDRFKDYNFAGSNLSVVLDLLSYNAYRDAFLSTMVASEMFLDTAQLRSSIVSHAKMLGYTPRSAVSAKAIVTVEVFPTDKPGTLTIPAGQVFTTSIGSRAYTFQTVKPFLVNPSPGGRYLATNVELFEGFDITDVFTVNQGVENQRFALSNANADTTNLVVTVNGVQWARAPSVLNLDGTSQVFFVQEGADGTLEIFFGEGIIGASPNHQSIVKASYLVASGIEANGADTFRCASPIAGYTSITTTTVSAAAGGSSQEDQETIRFNAPKLFQARERAVTTADYRVLLMDRFSEIEAVNVYGGEELVPPQFGKVFICVSTASVDAARTDAAKAEYFRYIKDRSPITIVPVIVDPDRVSLHLTSNVYYDYINYSVSSSEIESSVLSVISTFNNSLVTFNSTFAYSRLVETIDEADPSIISNDTTVLMGIDIDIASLETDSQRLYFRNSFATDCISVTSNSFMYNGKVCTIRDDMNGTLNIMNGDIILTKVGTVDYTAGVVTIQPFNLNLISNTLTIYAETASKNITATQNMLLSIDTLSIDITAVPTKPNG